MLSEQIARTGEARQAAAVKMQQALRDARTAQPEQREQALGQVSVATAAWSQARRAHLEAIRAAAFGEEAAA
jgi:hypothetical protein